MSLREMEREDGDWIQVAQKSLVVGFREYGNKP
jgi:hypothetical protein